MNNTSPFDGLAVNYDLERPRYPKEAFEYINKECNLSSVQLVMDVGAGTGIVLEGLLEYLPNTCQIVAVDVSEDMIEVGKNKFSKVDWILGEVESKLSNYEDIDLIIAGQSYQWLNRKLFLSVAQHSLSPNGNLVIIQNNRDYTAGKFLQEYETLLETWSPGYSRTYRNIDIESEISPYFDKIDKYFFEWEDSKTPSQFIAMSKSSTQSQRALKNNKSEYSEGLQRLVDKWKDKNNLLNIPYITEVFIATK